MNRRRLLRLAASFAALASPAAFTVPRSLAAAGAIDVEAILDDPATPVAGDPAGDVTIVAFMDYASCRAEVVARPRTVRRQGRQNRLVYKDWPLLTDASVAGARLALAAKYQGKTARRTSR